MGEHDADKAEDMMVQEWRQMLLAIIVQVEPSLSSRVTLCPVMWFCRGEWRHLASDHEHGQILFVCGDICTHECDFAFVPTQNFCACVIPHELTLQACMSPSLSPHVGWFREETGRACTPIDHHRWHDNILQKSKKEPFNSQIIFTRSVYREWKCCWCLN